ncbi:MAG TPA: tetratricopeptide repeat protein [Rhodanobacteraceae bacterium]
MSKMLAGVALALLMTDGMAFAAPVYSPSPYLQSTSQSQTVMRNEAQMLKQAKEKLAKEKAAKKGNQPAQKLYPNALRKSPDIQPVGKRDADEINTGLEAAKAHKTAVAQKILGPYASGKATDNKYLQAIALQALANLQYDAGNLPQAIAMLQQALATNALPNDTHFQLMYELAQFYNAKGEYQKSLETLQKWRKEGRRETAESYGMEGVLDYRLKNYKGAVVAIKKAKSLSAGKTHPQAWDQVLAASLAETGQGEDAIAAARQQLAANPKDATTRHNLISLLMQAHKYPEAIKAMETARSMDQLKAEGYVNLAKLYLINGQNSAQDPKPYADKAQAVLTDGATKGVLKRDYSYYKLKGDAALLAGETHAALAAYTKAAPLGHTGEADLMRSELLAETHKYSASRNAARQALSKGTTHKGKAYMMIANADRAMHDKPAAVKAMKKAAQDPETRAEALAWLKKAGY